MGEFVLSSQMTQFSKVHIVGIGGAGMSAIAMVLAEQGVSVSGSDLKASASFVRLRAYGVQLFLGHDAINVPKCDAVLVSSAIRKDNPEVAAAIAARIPVLFRSDFFPHLLRGKKPIAIAGTHGKTTTTSMVALALIAADSSPSYIIGGELNETGTSGAYGHGEYFVIEADESDKSFLSLGAYGAIITNLEPDHLETYGSYDVLKAAFRTFFEAVEGPKVLGTYLGDTLELSDVEGVVTFGFRPQDDYCLTDLKLGEMSTRFTLRGPGEESAQVDLLVPGRHNALNATGAIAMAHCLGVPLQLGADSLVAFTGVARRYQIRGELNGCLLVDDYAHLPAEIEAVIAASRAQWPHRRIVAVFQPHRFTRTRSLYREFARVLATADLVVLTDVYAAGETEIPGVSGELIALELNSHYEAVEALYHPQRSDLGEFMHSVIAPGDIILSLGAGDITTLATEILDNERARVYNRNDHRS